jgi:hypothetical protein
MSTCFNMQDRRVEALSAYIGAFPFPQTFDSSGTFVAHVKRFQKLPKEQQAEYFRNSQQRAAAANGTEENLQASAGTSAQHAAAAGQPHIIPTPDAHTPPRPHARKFGSKPAAAVSRPAAVAQHAPELPGELHAAASPATIGAHGGPTLDGNM